MNSKILAIMQPHFFPWIGYFDLINQSHSFIFLDDVKIEKQSWQVRNKILVQNTEKLITIPTVGSRTSIIKDVKVDTTSKWKSKLQKTLHLNYKKAPFINYIHILIEEEILKNQSHFLIDYNIRLISKLCQLLKINLDFNFSSKFNLEEAKSDKLLKLISGTQSSHYYSPIGAKCYIDDEGAFKKSTTPVTYQKYKKIIYNQPNSKKFTEKLSIIDLIANIGPDETIKVIKKSFLQIQL